MPCRLLRLLPALVFSLALACGLAAAGPAAAPRTIVVLGDSLTFGYGLPDPATQAYPALLQQKLDALASAPGAPADAPRWRVVNAGVSGDTSSGGLRRIDWVLRQPVAILVLALGSNDGLRGLDPALIERNLAGIAAKAQAKNPSLRVLLVGERMPPNLGDYATRFDAVFPRLAKNHGWAFVPFLLEGVGGVADLNQADTIHPNEEGHRRIAETVWAGLKPLLTEPPSPPAPAE